MVNGEGTVWEWDGRDVTWTTVTGSHYIGWVAGIDLPRPWWHPLRYGPKRWRLKHKIVGERFDG